MTSPPDSRHSSHDEETKLDDRTKQPSPPVITKHVGEAKTSASTTAPTATAPLAPPPRPANNPAADNSDYFSGAHGISSNHFNLEPNPFEQSFGNPVGETHAKGLLPPVASLTSPSSLLPTGTPGWPNSLRSGPLSPAMLAGPAGGGDYFSEPWKGGFPTPNESSLRTGLTPGGGGSMFPAPSPNSQALFNSLQSGGATPNTNEFYRAAVKMNNNFAKTANPPTSQPIEQSNNPSGLQQQPRPAQQDQSHDQQQQNSFGQHDANVVTSLLGLARADAHQSGSNNQFAMSTQPSRVNISASPVDKRPQRISPTLTRAGKNSIVSMSGSADTGGFSDSTHSDEAQPAKSRGGKRKAASSKGPPSSGRRKVDDGAVKGPAAKKRNTSHDNAVQSHDDEESIDDNIKAEMAEPNTNGKKMTDEEKRRNFLERNRIAALKCRQRKKQWLVNLQAKSEIFSNENELLSNQITQLREEIVNLKTMLLAHKDCPVSQAQGISGLAMTNFIGDINNHAAAWGMGMPAAGVPSMAMAIQAPHPQAMPRR